MEITQDSAPAGSARRVDQNDYITIERNPITRVGVFPYRGSSIGAPDPNKIYYVYRPASELSDPEAINSFKMIPLVDDHAMLGSSERGLTPAEIKGVHGTTGEGVAFEDGVLYTPIKIFSETLRRLLDSGKKALSIGYRCIYEKAIGKYNGQVYDYIQRKIRGNHLALVDSPRSDTWVLDNHMAFDHFDLALDSKEFDMADEDKKKEEKEAADRQAMDARMTRVLDWAETRMAKDEAEEKEKATKEKEAADQAAKDAAEKEAKECGDKSAKDAEEKARKETMDSAIGTLKTLASDVESIKKGGVKSLMQQIKERDTLAQQLTPFVGTFDHAEMTAEEVASYGIEKLGLKCPKGTERATLDGYLAGRGEDKRGYAMDSTTVRQGSKLGAFLKKAS